MHQVLTLDHGGRPSRWTSWEDAIIYKLKDLISWSLGDERPFRGGTNRKTGEQSLVYLPNIIALKNEVYDGRISLTNSNLFHRDEHRCCYCGEKFGYRFLSREHIHPVSRGGQNTWMNCATACKECNNRKGNRTLAEIGWKLLYVPYVPHRAEGLILEGRNIQADQMEFLKACLPAGSRALSSGR